MFWVSRISEITNMRTSPGIMDALTAGRLALMRTVSFLWAFFGPSLPMERAINWTIFDLFLHLQVIVHGMLSRPVPHKEQAAHQYQKGHGQIAHVHGP